MAKKRMIKIVGRYQITSMEMWDQEFVDAEVPGYINFARNGFGEFQFGYVKCEIDWQETERSGVPAVEFSFEGSDEMDPCSGRGWAILDGTELTGLISFHLGEKSGFTAAKVKP